MRNNKKLMMVLLLVLGIGFAAVTTTLLINGNVSVTTNQEDFDVKFTKAMLDGNNITSSAISQNGKQITFATSDLKRVGDKSRLDFTVKNNSSIYDANVVINCAPNNGSTNTDYYRITQNIPSSIVSKSKVSGNVEVELLKATTENITEKFTCTISASATERTTVGEDTPNSNIVKVMKYSTEDTDKCITGDEATCEELTVTGSSTYSTGTIVKYKVNSSTTRTFFVMHDDGNTLTMQDRENLLNATKWYADSDDNTHGPTTALTALESATSGWNNVENQTYTMGTTEFGWGTYKNAYTGCSASGCDRNSNYGYTLGTRTAKARMITMQEALALGCTTASNSCPIWMNNYLYDATSYGGTNTGTDTAYWTMSALSSNSRYAWYVDYYGDVYHYNTTYTDYGVRPVIVIEK